jgi:hypothetical protein
MILAYYPLVYVSLNIWDLILLTAKRHIRPLIINIIAVIPFSIILICKYNLHLAWAEYALFYYIVGRLIIYVAPVYIAHLWQIPYLDNKAEKKEISSFYHSTYLSI